VDGVTVPAGVYAQQLFVTNANIQTLSGDKITANTITSDKLFSNELSAMFATIGQFSSATTGARVVIEDDRISVFDASNVLRVRIGRLT
jgi:hypothetical protein